jgi:hypothetical protein
MAWAELPGSKMSVNLTPPDWTRFAEKAVDMIANRPIVNTAQIVQNAVDQINEILKQSSPQARMERQMKMLELQAKTELYKNYLANPKAYQWSAHGPVPIDTMKHVSTQLGIQQKQLAIRKLLLEQQDKAKKAAAQAQADVSGPAAFLNNSNAAQGTTATTTTPPTEEGGGEEESTDESDTEESTGEGG